VPVRRPGEAGLEDRLDDVQALGLIDEEHLQLASAADVDERQVVATDVDNGGHGGSGGHGAPCVERLRRAYANARQLAHDHAPSRRTLGSLSSGP
jgi:hypothetical protein